MKLTGSVPVSEVAEHCVEYQQPDAYGHTYQYQPDVVYLQSSVDTRVLVRRWPLCFVC